jgi:hypothetical protein
MAATSTSLNISNINVYGDLYGSILSPKVVSIGNVQHGILNVKNGGTGLQSVLDGQILIGKNGKYDFIRGNFNGDSIVWSSASGSWISERPSGLKDLNIELENNLFFDITSNYSIDNIKTYNLIEKQQQRDGFVVTDSNKNLTIRKISTTDLPTVFDNLILTNVNSDGNHYGNFSGYLVGSGAGQFEGVLKGDGKDIVNLDPNNIVDLNLFIAEALSASDLYLGNVTIQNLNSSDGRYNGTFTGFFSGDGSQLTNLPIKEMFSNDPNITVSETGEVALSETLYLNSSVTSPKIYSDKFEGNYYGNGAGLTNIQNDSLANPFVRINGQILYLGGSASISADFLVNNNNSNISASYESGILTLDFTKNLTVDSVNSVTMNAYAISGSFSGDGSKITNVDVSNITGLRSYILSILSSSQLDNYNIIFKDEKISLNRTLEVDFINTNNINGATASFINGEFNTITGYRLNTQELSSTMLLGDGSRIKEINYTNIPGLNEHVRSLFYGSDYINIGADGKISLDKTLEGVNYIIPGKNLVGGGSGITTVSLDERISLTSISASSITASNFSGDGRNIKNIPYANLVDTPFLSDYVLKTEMSGYVNLGTLSSSIQEGLQGLQGLDLTLYPTKTEVSASLTQYALKTELPPTIDTATYATINYVSSTYATTESLAEKANLSDLSRYALTSSLSIYQTITSADNLYETKYNVSSLSSSFDQRIKNVTFDTSSLVTTSSLNILSTSFDQRIKDVIFGTSSLATTSSLNALSVSFNNRINTLETNTNSGGGQYVAGAGISIVGNTISNTVTTLTDPSLVMFSVTSGAFIVGDLVALEQYPMEGLKKSDYTTHAAVNTFGSILYFSPAGTSAYVKTIGEIPIRIQAGSNFSTGSMVFVGLSGQAITYENIPENSIAIQVGTYVGNSKMIFLLKPGFFKS